MELPRLLALARLTPAQAAEIATSVLAEAARRPQTGPGCPATEQTDLTSVVIGTDGRVAWARCGDGIRGQGAPAPAPSGSAAAAIIADLASAARVRARHAGPAAEELLEVLDRAAANVAVAGVPGAARMLQEASAGIDRTAVRAELGALVRAIGRDARSPSPKAAGTATGGALSPAAGTAARQTRANGKVGTGRRRVGAWLLSAVVLAAVVLLEVAVLRGRIAADINMLLTAGHSGSAPASAPKPDGPPITLSAPAAAGPVRAVDLRPLASCAPGEPCSFRVLVRLAPAPASRVVTWSYRIVNRCTGASQSAPGGSVTVRAGADQAVAVGIVPLRARQAAAVVAVTGGPAIAASPPVSIGSCLSH